MGAWLDEMRWWFVVPWLTTIVVVVRWAAGRRTKMGTYWWEPESSLPFGVTLIGGMLASSATVFVLAGSGNIALRLFIGGLLAAFVATCLMVGAWYEVELFRKGLKPRYRQSVHETEHPS